MSDKKTKEQKNKDSKTTKDNTKVGDEYAKMSLQKLREALQKLYIDVKTGVENDTSKLKKIKKEIARKLTLQNLKK
ncbi:MAG: hypothetical protein KatS3mg085_806 [Candidatus Dojkabacteria bacterium]|nr:MAG: hypothetical protein KatS3mg085_806 [Candidatus Dojkabacteria bacterium]